MEAKKYYIEFVGPHAAGKTTTIYKIVDEDMFHPYVAIQPYSINRSNLHFVLHIPWLIISNLGHLLYVNFFFLRYAEWQWGNIRDAWHFLMKMIILHPYYNRFSFDVWFKDDMLHLLPHIVFKSEVDIEKAFSEYFHHFAYLYDGIIFMKVPNSLTIERSAMRHKGESVKSKNVRESVFTRASFQSRSMEQMLMKQDEVPCLFLDGTDTVDENANKVVKFVKERVISG